MMRSRLARRGVDASYCSGWHLMGQTPSMLKIPTGKTVMCRMTTGVATESVTRLAEGVLKAMLTSKIKHVAVAVCAVSLFATGAGVFGFQATREQPGREAPEALSRREPPTARLIKKSTRYFANAGESYARTYYVGDLLQRIPPAGGQPPAELDVDLNSIADFISSAVVSGACYVRDASGDEVSERRGRANDRPKSDDMDDRRRIGFITPFPLTNSLIIRHTDSVHDEVADVLRIIRRYQDLVANKALGEQRAEPPSDASKAIPSGSGLRLERIRRLRRELNQELEALGREGQPLPIHD
jgi:hypothetical protein